MNLKYNDADGCCDNPCLFSGYVRIGLVLAAWAVSETPSVFVCLHSVFIALDGKKIGNFVKAMMT